ncbi:hypothetical protein BKA64DRAFT_673919 [Cadophora sp. MPI-SDFR-AT-0126]|nr:hypothetical protein BKA64DRAFT_673919 [Leotiomycetes sp. MPI-SDFR-AT-0126]
MALRAQLYDPPDADEEVRIVTQLWNKTIQDYRPDNYRSYFRYYGTECRRLRLGISKDGWLSTTMVAQTHEHVLFIIRSLSNSHDFYRPALRDLLRLQFGSADDLAYNRSIDFAMRIFLTLNVREEHFRTHTPRTPTIQWSDKCTLTDFVARNFPQATTAAGSLQLDHTFTVANMHRLSGIDVEWTPCLADHLRFDKRRRLLRIYPFKQILLDHLHLCSVSKNPTEKLNQSRPRALLPETVLRETLVSLSLLFPQGDIATEDFMLQHDHTFHLEGPFNESRPQSLADFDHWRNRLLEVHQIFHSPPVGWMQIWADRRNPLQWYTFWIAIVILVLTVVFGIISTVVGVLQTCLAYEAVKLARLQLVAAGA